MRKIPDPVARRKWRRVTPAEPCPICRKPDWCLIAVNGTAALCQRVESSKRCGEAGWLHHLTEPAASPKKKTKAVKATPTATPKPVPEFTLEQKGKRPTDRQRARLAAELRLPVEALDALPFGWDGKAWTLPEMDPAGTVIGVQRRFPGGKKLMVTGSRRGLTLTDLTKLTPGHLFIVEGQSDVFATAHAGLCCVGRPSNSGGVELLAARLADLPPEWVIIVVGENDQKPDGTWPGRDGARTVAAGLTEKLARPVRVALPPEESKDVRDWLTADARGDTPWPERGRQLWTYLTGTVEDVTSPPNGSKWADALPEILIGTDEHRVNEEATAALVRETDVFHRGGTLVHVVEQEVEPNEAAVVRRPVGAPLVRELAKPILREKLTRCALWLRPTEEGPKPAHPPDWCVAALHARCRWRGLPRLDAVVSHPVLLPDGSLLTANGYHRPTALLARIPPDLVVQIPDSPTRADVAAAVEVLVDPLTDFPFETPAHRATWLASLLTPLAWYAFDGPAPLFLIDGNVRGVGKGLSADVAALTLTGRRFPTTSYTNDREEMRKRITTLAVEGERLVLLDNLAGTVGNDILDAALTSDRWKDRLLGGNRVYDGPLHVVWYATGNNVQLVADTSRRTAHVRMETADERPETKIGFRYPDLRAHVRANRGRLLSAALTLLRGWAVAGRPTHGLTPWGSFEGWSSVVREVVVFAGLPDPGETRLALQTAADRDAASMTDVLAGLCYLDPDRRGLTAGEIVERLAGFAKRSDPVPEEVSILRAAIEELCGRLDARALGYRFRHFARRNFDGRMLDRAGEDRQKGNRWAAYPASAAPRRRPDPSPASPLHAPGGKDVAGDAGDAGDRLGPCETHEQDGRLFKDYREQMLPD